jgi:ABC-type amino acid transport substrate-binding protein
VQPGKLPAFASTTTLAQLKTLRGGQGADWPDTTILRAAGLDIDESARYGDLFQKLAAGRIDYFPRSVQEIRGELEVHRSEGFVIEPTLALALHYPTAMHFFVNKQRTDLAADIRKGLEIALKDGSFQALFMQNFGVVLNRAQLDERRVFELANPLLSPETPLADARLWYRPGH